MIESVTDIIVARSRPDEGLRTMLMWSVAAHSVVLAVALVTSLGGEPPPQEPVMTISLGGVPGPRTSGLTQVGARAVQAPTPATPERPVVTPPAPTPPKMALPDPRTPPRPQPRPTQAPPQASARKPSTGPEPTEGSSRVDTGVKRGQGFGLSSGGGAGGQVQLDVQNFCCPDYLTQMVTIIQAGWNQSHGVVGSTTMVFTIHRDGSIQAPLVEIPSGFIALDSAALRAVQLARLPPLPAAFPNPMLTVHMRFDYQR